MTNTTNNNHKIIFVFDLLVLFISVTGITAVTLLALGWFSAATSLVIGCVITVTIVTLLRRSMTLKIGTIDPWLLLILLVALFFRIGPFLWIMGGQDQGLYVNMSAVYERTGSAFIKEKVRDLVPSNLKADYDKKQILFKVITEDPKELKGEYPKKFNTDKGRYFCGMTLPGVYIKNIDKSEYVFQFYPLHPLWMAMFGKMLGRDNAVYSLVIFSLLSIIVFYKIGRDVAQNAIAARLIALLLAVNPLHAFITKLPVTESLSLFLSSAGLYYMIKYIGGESSNINRLYYVITIGMFCCLFLNHVSGILYLPIFYIMVLASFVLFGYGDFALRSLKIVIAIYACFAISVIYGYFYSFPYFFEIYNAKFGEYFGQYWILVLLAVALVLVLILYYVVNVIRLRCGSPLFNYDKIRTVLPYLLIIVLLLAAIKMFLLAFTDHYSGHWFISNVHNASHKGMASLLKNNLIVFTEYISPIGLMFIVWAFFSYSRNGNISITLLQVFILCFMIIRLFVFHFTPSSYYYARYLLTELIPYTLLLVSIFASKQILEGGKIKKVTIVCLVCITAYFTILTLPQLRGSEADGAKQSLDKLISHVNNKDLLVYAFNDDKYFTYPDSQLLTPLKYYYGLDMYFINRINDTRDQLFTAVSTHYENVYVLSKKPMQAAEIDLVNILPYKQGMYEVTSNIPPKFAGYTEYVLYLYRYKKVGA